MAIRCRRHATSHLVGPAFALMLKVKQELLRNILLHVDEKGYAGYTIRETSEDNAAVVLERALLAAERRGHKTGLKASRRSHAR